MLINNKIINWVDPNNIGKVYIPWLINKDKSKVLAFRYDYKINYLKHFSEENSIEYEIFDVISNENIKIYQIPKDGNIFINTSQSRLYMQAINDYFTSDNFDYPSIFNSIKNNYDHNKIKDKLINYLHQEKFWNIKDIESEVDIMSPKAREIVISIFKKPVLQEEQKIESVTTQENESSNQSPKFLFLKKVKSFFSCIKSWFQKNIFAQINKNSSSNNIQFEPSNLNDNLTERFDQEIKPENNKNAEIVHKVSSIFNRALG